MLKKNNILGNLVFPFSWGQGLSIGNNPTHPEILLLSLSLFFAFQIQRGGLRGKLTRVKRIFSLIFFLSALAFAGISK